MALARGIVTPQTEGVKIVNDRSKIKNNILAIHQGVAILTRQPIFTLKEDEGQILSDALCDVFDHYGIDLAGKAGVWVSLISAVGVVYVPRALMLREVTRQQRPSAVPTSINDVMRANAGKVNYGNDVNPQQSTMQ